MDRAWRIGMAGAAAIAVFFFTFWIGGALLSIVGLPDWVIVGVAPVAALVVGRFAYRGGDGFVREVAMGAVVVGTIGFVAGFFGPMILAPGANQGPLLGLFITGPLGVIAGAVGGAVRWTMRHAAATREVRARRAHPSSEIGRDATTAVLSVHARWLAFETDGAPARVVDLCADDVVWRPPGEVPVEGKAAVRAWLAAQPLSVVERVEIDNLRVDVEGETAVKQADFTTHVRCPPGAAPQVVQGAHVWTLRRTATDVWLVTDVAWTVAGDALPDPR